MNNDLIEDLYNKIDKLELINKEQALDLIKLRIYIKTIKRNCKRDKAKLRNRIDKTIEYIKSEKYFDDYEVAKLFEKYDKILLEKLGDKE